MLNFRFIYDEDDKAFRIETRKRMSDDPWTLNAVGRLTEALAGTDDTKAAARAEAASGNISHDTHYRVATALGLNYGPAFQTIERVQVFGNDAVAELRAPDAVVATLDKFILHPAMLDGCLQTLLSILFANGVKEGNAYLPYQFNGVKIFRPHALAVRCHTQLRSRSDKSLVADFSLFDADNTCVAKVSGLRFLRAELHNASAGTRRFRCETPPFPATDPISTLLRAGSWRARREHCPRSTARPTRYRASTSRRTMARAACGRMRWRAIRLIWPNSAP